MNPLFIDRYALLVSPIHRLDVSLKIISTLTLLVLLLMVIPLFSRVSNPIWYIYFGLILLIIAVISRVPLTFLLTRSALVLPFSGLIVLVNYISGYFEFAHMIEALFKSTLSVFTLLLLTSTTPFHQILKQLSRWHAPKLMVIILAFMYRYFFLIMGEIQALDRARKMRYPNVYGWKKIGVYANIFGLLLIRSFERAEHVYQAMQMRGFTGDLT